MSAAAPAIDLTDVDRFVRGEHHAMFDWLRANDPVHWHELPGDRGFWVLTRHRDLVEAYRRHTVFSSCGGAMLGGSFRSEADTAAGLMLVAADPPRHRLLRQIVHRAFAPHLVARIAAEVTTQVELAVRRAVADGGCDFATDIAPALPAGALMGVLEIPVDEAHHLIGLTRRMIGFRDPVLVGDTSGADERLRLAGIQSEIFEFFADLVRARERSPGDGLVDILLRADLNGHPLTEEEILYNCMNVAVGGNETSSYSACAGALALAENPAEHRRLLDYPELLDPALNEILRWSSTNAYVQRIARRDVEVDGRHIHAGDSVTLWNVSANRDDEQFPEPHRFDVARTPNRHLTYGSGVHRCIGAPVAHVELSILFRCLLQDRLTFEPAGVATRLRSNFILGITHLPLQIRPSS